MSPRKRTDHRSESVIQSAGERFMASLGFSVIRFSQARATRQTPGIPDDLFISPDRRSAVWWEAKTEIGRQRGEQAAFQALCEAVGWEYVLGMDDALHEWAIGKGFVERIGPNGLRVIPAARVTRAA